MEREKPVYSQSNQLTNQPKNETQFNPMSIISRCYSNGFVGFFIYSLAWLLTHPSVEWFSIQRGRERERVLNIHLNRVLMAKKRTIKFSFSFFFFFKLELLPSFKHTEYDGNKANIIFTRHLLKKLDRGKFENRAKSRKNRKLWAKLKWIWMALKNLSAVCAPLCSIISIFFFVLDLSLFIRFVSLSFFFFKYFEWCSSNPACNHEIIDKLDFILIFSTTYTSQKRRKSMKSSPNTEQIYKICKHWIFFCLFVHFQLNWLKWLCA